MRPALLTAVATATAAVLATTLFATLAGCDSGDQSDAAPYADRATSAGGGLDACTVVTTRMLNTDLGLGLTGAGEAAPSFYGDAKVTDCSWFVGSTIISVYATDRAGQDLPAGDIDGYLQSGGAQVPGADRGVAYATSNTDGSNVDLIVVVGQRGIELAASSPGPFSQDQAQSLGRHVAAALG